MIAEHNLIFKKYLTQAKQKVLKNLSLKIFPRTQLEDYEFLRLLGQGSYGQVLAAKNIHTKKTFAVKVIKKKNLVKEEQLKHLISEIRILNAIEFHFTISLECYFTNKCNVFIVLPEISGGHFFKLLKKVKKIDEASAKFYAGQVVLAIEYLHFMGIIYRDLKPENILLDKNGYVKLVDFGFSKRIGNGFTYTFCGTPEYIAPEILLSKGYSKTVDWWAFGIFLYEICNGAPPFTSRNELKLFEKILSGQITWPGHFSNEMKSILQGLLQVNKTKRLGCMKNKSDDIKNHEWFTRLDWNALCEKKIVPPIKYIPTKHGNEDSNKKFSFARESNCHAPPNLPKNIDVSI